MRSEPSDAETNTTKETQSNSREKDSESNDKYKNQKINDAFYMLYNKLKEIIDVPFSPENFIENAKLFSQPILYRFLLVFTIAKFLLTILYFFFWKKNYFNFSISINIIMLICSILLVFKDKLSPYKIFFFLRILNDYYTRRTIQVIYIISFIFIDNYLCYYFPDFTFSINVGVPVFIFIAIIFFESKHFHYGLLYIYIWNFLCFLYFLNLHSFLNVYLPVNIDIGIFILISVIAHNVGRKLLKCEMFLKFYEKVLETFNKELGVSVVCNGSLVYPDIKKSENKGGRKESIGSKNDKKGNNKFRFIDDLMNADETSNSNEGDYVSSLSMTDKNVELFDVPGFEGFEVSLPNNSNNKELPI